MLQFNVWGGGLCWRAYGGMLARISVAVVRRFWLDGGRYLTCSSAWSAAG